MSSLLQLLEDADEKSVESIINNDDELDYFATNNVPKCFSLKISDI